MADEISLSRLTSNGNKEKAFRMKAKDITTKRLATLFNVSFIIGRNILFKNTIN